jgi:hypothetical protein
MKSDSKNSNTKQKWRSLFLWEEIPNEEIRTKFSNFCIHYCELRMRKLFEESERWELTGNSTTTFGHSTVSITKVPKEKTQTAWKLCWTELKTFYEWNEWNMKTRCRGIKSDGSTLLNFCSLFYFVHSLWMYLWLLCFLKVALTLTKCT